MSDQSIWLANKEIILANLVPCSELIESLKTFKILAPSSLSELMDVESRYDMVQRLFTIFTRQNTRLSTFCDALQMAGHLFLADHLRTEKVLASRAGKVLDRKQVEDIFPELATMMPQKERRDELMTYIYRMLKQYPSHYTWINESAEKYHALALKKSQIEEHLKHRDSLAEKESTLLVLHDHAKALEHEYEQKIDETNETVNYIKEMKSKHSSDIVTQHQQITINEDTLAQQSKELDQQSVIIEGMNVHMSKYVKSVAEKTGQNSEEDVSLKNEKDRILTKFDEGKYYLRRIFDRLKRLDEIKALYEELHEDAKYVLSQVGTPISLQTMKESMRNFVKGTQKDLEELRTKLTARTKDVEELIQNQATLEATLQYYENLSAKTTMLLSNVKEQNIYISELRKTVEALSSRRKVSIKKMEELEEDRILEHLSLPDESVKAEEVSLPPQHETWSEEDVYCRRTKLPPILPRREILSAEPEQTEKKVLRRRIKPEVDQRISAAQKDEYETSVIFEVNKLKRHQEGLEHVPKKTPPDSVQDDLQSQFITSMDVVGDFRKVERHAKQITTIKRSAPKTPKQKNLYKENLLDASEMPYNPEDFEKDGQPWINFDNVPEEEFTLEEKIAKLTKSIAKKEGTGKRRDTTPHHIKTIDDKGDHKERPRREPNAALQENLLRSGNMLKTNPELIKMCLKDNYKQTFASVPIYITVVAENGTLERKVIELKKMGHMAKFFGEGVFPDVSIEAKGVLLDLKYMAEKYLLEELIAMATHPEEKRVHITTFPSYRLGHAQFEEIYKKGYFAVSSRSDSEDEFSKQLAETVDFEHIRAVLRPYIGERRRGIFVPDPKAERLKEKVGEVRKSLCTQYLQIVVRVPLRLAIENTDGSITRTVVQLTKSENMENFMNTGVFEGMTRRSLRVLFTMKNAATRFLLSEFESTDSCVLIKHYHVLLLPEIELTIHEYTELLDKHCLYESIAAMNEGRYLKFTANEIENVKLVQEVLRPILLKDNRIYSGHKDHVIVDVRVALLSGGVKRETLRVENPLQVKTMLRHSESSNDVVLTKSLQKLVHAMELTRVRSRAKQGDGLAPVVMTREEFNRLRCYNSKGIFTILANIFCEPVDMQYERRKTGDAIFARWHRRYLAGKRMLCKSAKKTRCPVSPIKRKLTGPLGPMVVNYDIEDLRKELNKK